MALPPTVTCSEAYQGPLCAACAEGYALSGEVCYRCWPKASAVAVSLAIAVFIAAALAVIVALRIRQPTPSELSQPPAAPPSLHTAKASKSALFVFACPTMRAARGTAMTAKEATSVALRITLTYISAISSIAAFSNMAEGFLEVGNSTALVDGLGFNSFPFACAFDLSFVPLTWLYFALPLAIAALFMAVYAVLRCCHPRVAAKWVTVGSAAYVVVFFLLYPRLLATFVSVFTVVRLPPAGSFLHAYPLVQAAATDETFIALAIGAGVAGFVYIFLLPGVVGVALYRLHRPQHRRSKGQAPRQQPRHEPSTWLRSTAFQRSTVFLVEGYEGRWFLWEFTVIGRKVLLAAIVLSTQTSRYQLLFAQGIFMAALLGTVVAKPFKSAALNVLEASSLSVLTVTTWLLLVGSSEQRSLQAESATGEASSLPSLATALSLLVLFLNGAMLVYLGVVLLIGYINTFRRGIRSLRRSRRRRLLQLQTKGKGGEGPAASEASQQSKEGGNVGQGGNSTIDSMMDHPGPQRSCSDPASPTRPGRPVASGPLLSTAPSFDDMAKASQGRVASTSNTNVGNALQKLLRRKEA